MKRKHIVTTSLGLVFVLALMCFTVFAVNSVDLSKKRESINASQNEKVSLEKTNEKLDHSWSDIKKSLKDINLSEYNQIDIENLPLFSEGKGSITDKNKVQSIIKNTIKPHFGELTIGSTEPLILVKNDGNAVLFCYKTANGTNIIHIHEFNDKEKNWSETTKNIDGEVPLKD